MNPQKNDSLSITVNGVPIRWNELGKGFTFFGIDAIIFWTKPSLLSILEPLRKELGGELYSLLVAFEASKGTYDDYQAIMGKGNFAEGLAAWGTGVDSAGWGNFSIKHLDLSERKATIEIENPWEMKIFKTDYWQDAVPFLRGKIAGIFSHAFKTNCKAEIIHLSHSPNKVIINVEPSQIKLEDALLEIQKRKNVSENAQLKLINTALRKNQQRLNDILQTIGERIWETDEHLIITHLSDIILSQQLDKEAKSFLELGKSLETFIHADDLPYFKKSCEQLKSGSSSLMELKVRIQNSEGQCFWTNFKFKSLKDLAGMHCGFLGSARNVHKETLLEMELEKQREAAITTSRLSAMGVMAAGIAHELNNPLSELVANAWLLKDSHETGKLNQEDFNFYLSNIERTSKRMTIIIKGMLSYSRDGEKEPSSIHYINDIIQDTLIFCQKRFINHKVELKILPFNPDLKLNCRPTQISQIILNLLNNSFDAVLGLTDKWIQLNVIEKEKSIQIEVIDSGRGIARPIAEKLMQPFFTTKDGDKGTGLGLSVAKTIVESHQGKIYYDDSSPHTRFVIELPKT